MLICLYSSVENGTKGRSIVFRDFIYMDINRVQSIIAQLQQGLLNEVLEGKTNQTTGKMQMATNLLAMLLPFSVSGSVEHSRASSLSESRVLHDYAFEVARLSLEEGGFLLERDELDWDEIPESSFVLVRGAAQILDYGMLQRIAENYNRLDDFFNSEDSQNQKKKRYKENEQFMASSVLFETFFKDSIRVEIINEQGCSFVGSLEREHLREDIQALIYKHGSKPKGEWAMLAEIIRIPQPDEDPEKVLKEAMTSQPEKMGGSSASNLIDQVVTVFNGFQELMGSVSYPNVAVSPVAVYREIESQK